MFNNIIYFILVLLIFNISFPGSPPEDFFLSTLIPLLLSWVLFALYSARVFGSLLRRVREGGMDDGVPAEQYQRIGVRLSVLAIIFFALSVYLFNLKQWLNQIPGFGSFSVLQGILALCVFFFYLCTIWYFGCPVYRAIFRVSITRASFIRSNLRFNLPILFPWAALSLVYDLLALSPWSGPGSFINGIYGQVLFFAVLITLLMVVMPKFVQFWWGCRPLTASEKGYRLDLFLKSMKFRYRSLLTWPIFEGRIMTAGIMGIVPRYRYILVTDALLEALSLDELKAVLAHEVGHARYRHLLFYMLFFVGFMVISFGLSDLLATLALLFPGAMETLSGSESRPQTLFYLFMALPMLVTLLVYFRYVMGFFMRNFERQADLYSALIMGTPVFTISSLEKIAFLSGKSREVPSWHHFSIKQRVDYLLRAYREPGLIKGHNRFVLRSFIIYLICICSLGYLLNFGPLKRQMGYMVIERVLNREVLKQPHNLDLYRDLAVIYQEMGKEGEAIDMYERIIALDPNLAVALNNLAWLLVTTSDDALRDPDRALSLARRAVRLKRSPMFLDTLAEALFAKGLVDEAIRTIREAIAGAAENRAYYEAQLKRFSKGLPDAP